MSATPDGITQSSVLVGVAEPSTGGVESVPSIGAVVFDPVKLLVEVVFAAVEFDPEPGTKIAMPCTLKGFTVTFIPALPIAEATSNI